MLVGNHNFGYGHPHYPPMRAMRHLGIAGVVAESFSPGYWRGEISMGFPQARCPGILGLVDRWDEIEVDWDGARCEPHPRDRPLAIEPLRVGDREMLEAGGLGSLPETNVRIQIRRDVLRRGNAQNPERPISKHREFREPRQRQKMSGPPALTTR